MTAYTHTIRVSDKLFQRLNQRAKVSAQSIDEVASQLLERQLPAGADTLPEQVQSDLDLLAQFTVPVLKRIAGSQFPIEREALYDQLLQDRLLRELTNAENEQLDVLRHEADLLMLRKARALALLKEHGIDIETLLDSAVNG